MFIWSLSCQQSVLSAITVTNICKSFTHKMAAKINWHRYGTKLRHCHPMYDISSSSFFCYVFTFFNSQLQKIHGLPDKWQFCKISRQKTALTDTLKHKQCLLPHNMHSLAATCWCYKRRTFRDPSVCVTPCKNAWADWDAVWKVGSDGAKEPCIIRGP